MSALEWAGALALLAALWLTGRVAYRRGYRRGRLDEQVYIENLASGYIAPGEKPHYAPGAALATISGRRAEPAFARGPERAEERQSPGTDVMP